MTSQSKPGSASENSRRNFLERIGALAAASSAVASASAAPQQQSGAPGPGRGPGRNAQHVPGPLSKEPMPEVRFGK